MEINIAISKVCHNLLKGVSASPYSDDAKEMLKTAILKIFEEAENPEQLPRLLTELHLEEIDPDAPDSEILLTTLEKVTDFIADELPTPYDQLIQTSASQLYKTLSSPNIPTPPRTPSPTSGIAHAIANICSLLKNKILPSYPFSKQILAEIQGLVALVFENVNNPKTAPDVLKWLGPNISEETAFESVVDFIAIQLSPRSAQLLRAAIRDYDTPIPTSKGALVTFDLEKNTELSIPSREPPSFKQLFLKMVISQYNLTMKPPKDSLPAMRLFIEDVFDAAEKSMIANRLPATSTVFYKKLLEKINQLKYETKSVSAEEFEIFYSENLIDLEDPETQDAHEDFTVGEWGGTEEKSVSLFRVDPHELSQLPKIIMNVFYMLGFQEKLREYFS